MKSLLKLNMKLYLELSDLIKYIDSYCDVIMKSEHKYTYLDFYSKLSILCEFITRIKAEVLKNSIENHLGG